MYTGCPKKKRLGFYFIARATKKQINSYENVCPYVHFEYNNFLERLKASEVSSPDFTIPN